jgi:type IV pilus assembly protein PilA
MREEREGGFTLIELLVVILIIAILAAIAIPVFLNQRQRGWTAQSESALKNAATAMESYATGNNGAYPAATTTGTATTTALEPEGYNPVTGVDVIIVSSSNTGYCLRADHAQGVPDLFYDSNTGNPSETSCAATV